MSATVTHAPPPALPGSRPGAAAPGPKPRLVIRPSSGWRLIDLRELARYWDLLWFLALRDIQLRYKQTLFGVAWAVLQPVANMAVLAVFFGYFCGLNQKTDAAVPYSLFALCALLPWQLFSATVTQASTSLVGNRALITKVYFPRALVPLAPLLCNLLDFAIASAVLGVLMAVAGVAPGWEVVLLPGFLLLGVGAAVGLGLALSALNALYHDVQYTLGLLIQVWMFATPVAYPSGVIPPPWRALLGLNPMATVVEGFRWCLLGTAPPDGVMVGLSVAVTALLLGGGLLFFRRLEPLFTDTV